MNRYLKKIASRVKNDIVIITFGNIAYVNVILNWVAHINRLQITNYIVISIDDNLYDILSDRNVPVVKLEDIIESKGFGLWAIRMKCFLELLKHDINFIHSDADAIWLKNALPVFHNTPHDVIASQGTVFPKTFSDKYGFVICMGLIFFNASEKNINLLEETLFKVGKWGDDQEEFNNVIMSREPIVEGDVVEGLFISGASLNMYVVGKNMIARTKMNRKKDTYIYHPLTNKTANDKIQIFKDENMYHLS